MWALCFYENCLNMQTQLSLPGAILATDLKIVSPSLEPPSRTIGVVPYFNTNAKPHCNKAYFIRVPAGYRFVLKQADPARCLSRVHNNNVVFFIAYHYFPPPCRAHYLGKVEG